MQIGSLKWGQMSGGRLSFWESWIQILQGLDAQLRGFSRPMLKRLGFASPSLPRAAWQGLELPQSQLCQASVVYCREVSPDYLVAHCFRSYAWAVLLAQRDDLSFDPELLLVACMLHDLGLTDSAGPTQDIPCFAVSGAREAERFLRSQHCSSDTSKRIAEAISLHLNVKVPVEAGVETHLLRQGSGLDVIGARSHEIGHEARRQVLERYPRRDFAEQISSRLADPCICRPGSRIHLLCRGGFIGMVAKSPLNGL